MKKMAMWMIASCILTLALFATAMRAAPQAKVDLTGTWAITEQPDPQLAAAMAAAAAAAANNPPAAQGQMAPAAPARGGRGGPQMLTLTQSGDTLSGTIGGGRGPAIPIKGMVSGSAVTLTIPRRLSDGIPRDNTYTGTVDGDTITGTVKEATVDPTQGYTVNFTAKRQAAQ
jgi:hypothetical protein